MPPPGATGASPAATTRDDEAGRTSSATPSGIRLVRVVVLAVPLIIANGFWTMALWGRAGYATGQSFPTVVSLYYNAIATLLLLLGANAVARRWRPRAALVHGELLLLYVMVTVASSIGGHDWLEIVWPTIGYVTWFGTPENGWGRVLEHAPSWLVLADRAALRPFFAGASTLYTPEHLRLWAAPVAAWSALMLVLAGMMLCAVELLRERWIRHERLAYPVTTLPLALTEPGGTLLRSRALWVGFVLAAGLDLLNGLHHLYPHLPGVGGALYEADLRRAFPSRPFSAIGWTPIALYPFAVGLTFFIPLDLSFSVWFFYLVGKAVRVAGDAAGYTGDPQFPYTAEQGAGAWVGLAVAALWSSSGHLRRQLQLAVRGGSRSAEQALSPRAALLGLAAGWCTLLLLAVAARVPLWTVAVFFALFFALALAITRVRAELGPPSHDISAHPLGMMVAGLGTERLGAPALVLLTLFTSFNRAYRCHPMPAILESYAMGARRGISERTVAGCVALALVVGTVVSAWAFLDHAYRYGGAVFGEHGQLRANFGQMVAWESSQRMPRPAAVQAMCAGLAGVVALAGLRRVLPWNPFHPAGYALSLGAWNANWFWFSVFAGWLLKWAVLHAGGLRAYRGALPFFAGLVLGEFAMGALWSLLGIALGMPMYRFLS